jgi:hypothetical protein
MKVAILISTTIALLIPAFSFAQSDRLGNRLDERFGERPNEGRTPLVRGTYGPDPYLGPGSVSPFARFPVVPMQSAPIQQSSDPYVSRHPPTEPALTQEPSERSGALKHFPKPSSPDAATKAGSPQQSPSEAGLGERSRTEKLGRELKEEPSAKLKKATSSVRIQKQTACVNGRVRTSDGDCSGPLRPRP